MTRRLQMCARKHFDALEPDNMDGYSNQTGFKPTAKNQLSYDEWVAGEAHHLGWPCSRSNDPNRPANSWSCTSTARSTSNATSTGAAASAGLLPVPKAGKPVLMEYKASLFPGFCALEQNARLGMTAAPTTSTSTAAWNRSPAWASANA